MSEDNKELSFCRQCGGDRHHSIIYKHERPWEENDAPVYGYDAWSILECRGCQTVTFVHTRWFSEDEELGDDGWEPVIHRKLYPPSLSREEPEWRRDPSFGFTPDELWIDSLYTDIYAALDTGAAALAAMGVRAIIDFVVTSQVGDCGSFAKKLQRMHEKGFISEIEVETLKAAFDAGSAAAHRGHHPEQRDLHILLDITDSLLYQIYVAPARRKRQSDAAAKLRSNTPQRPTRIERPK